LFVQTLTLDGNRWQRWLSFFSGIGMMAASILTMRHYFMANFPESIFEGSFCDISAFFNCDSSAFSVISQFFGIPIGFFGLIAGALVAIGVIFPSEDFERTNTFLSLFNVLGVVVLFLYSVIKLGSLCLLCSGYYVFSILSFFLFWRYGIGRGQRIFPPRFLRPSLKLLVTLTIVTGLGGRRIIQIHTAKETARVSISQQIVRQFYELPQVGNPSFISPYWTVRSTDFFEEAPIQVLEFSDFLCPDCLFLTQQLDILKEEFAGQINIAFQFFPLEAQCNQIVAKDLHPGACELSLLAAYDPSRFQELHDEIFANFNSARNPDWRRELALRHGLEGAFDDPTTRDLVQTIINTGSEYDKTSDSYAHGIRSTPTMIINGRMIIGTLPIEHMRAIFQALVDESTGGSRFLENWVPPKARTVKH